LTTNDNQPIDNCIEEYKNANYYSAIICLSELAIQLSKNNGNESEIVKCLYYLSMSYFELSNQSSSTDYYDKSFQLFELVIQLANKNKNKEVIETIRSICKKEDSKEEMTINRARAIYCLGLSTYEEKDYAEAAELFSRYMEILYKLVATDQRKIRFTTVKVLFYKGNSQMELKEYWEGIHSFVTHLNVMKENYLGRGNYHAIFNIGMCFQRLNDNNKAIYYFKQSLMQINNTEKKIYLNQSGSD
jgi:tetratricopeptide (TPR) repeat protein